jgi:hypothetical protein
MKIVPQSMKFESKDNLFVAAKKDLVLCVKTEKEVYNRN